jgi:hypothetical protein
LLVVVPSSQAIEKRCGWVQNPTPANWWLVDRVGWWTMGIQGGYQAPGMDNLPDFTEGEYVATNGSAGGYACACMDVNTDRRRMKITRIYSVEQLPLSRCRRDRTLPSPN